MRVSMLERAILAALISLTVTACQGGGGGATQCAPASAACAATADCCSGLECGPTGVCLQPGSCAPLATACGSPTDCCSGACAGGACVEPSTCGAVGTPCQDAPDCCTDLCASGTCVEPPDTCGAVGDACAAPTECCSGTCTSAKCALPPAPACLAQGTACTAAEADRCCSGTCEDGACTTAEFCKAPGLACANDGECCSVSCLGGACASNSCVASGDPAGSATQCCTGLLGTDGRCAVLPPAGGFTCGTLGDGCAGDLECCSHNCQGGSCVPAYTCHAPGDICYGAADCCSGLCSATGGAPGRCEDAAGGCGQDGTPCDGASNCCTRLCVDLGSGTKVCQPAGGCRMTGNYCDSDDACCNINQTAPVSQHVHCDPADHTCDNGGSCNPPGNICGASTDVNASQNCCDGKKDVCKADANGVLRCFGGQTTACPAGWDGNDPACCIPQGDICQFRDQCCGHAPCVPDGAGVLRCAATATCKSTNAPCSGPDDTTCCAGACSATEGGFHCVDVPPGSQCLPQGTACTSPPPSGAETCCAGAGACVGGACETCAPKGNACTSASQCCTGQCLAGVCATACVAETGSCTVTADCCTGLACDVPPGSTGGTCRTSATCADTGQTCGSNADCCNHDPADPSSEICDEGTCAAPAPVCSGIAQLCTVSSGVNDCCAGLQCLTTSNTTLVPCGEEDVGCFCDTGACRELGTSCSSNQPCCSGGLYCVKDANPGQLCDDTTPCSCVQAG